MKILNYTPHSLSFFDSDSINYDAAIRKWVVKDDSKSFLTIPSNGVLNAKIDTVSGVDIGGIPTFHKKVTGCDPLPDGNDVVVVSTLYAVAAAKSGLDMSRIFTVADPVFSPDGRTVLGCRGIRPTI